MAGREDIGGVNPGFDVPYPTFGELLLSRAEDDDPGVLFEDEVYSWRQVVAAAAERAEIIADWDSRTAGSRQGRPLHLGVLLDNVPEYLFLLCGAALAGAVVVGVNPTRRGVELAADVRGVDCDVLVTEPKGADLLAGLDVGVPRELTFDITSREWADLVAEHSGAAPGLTDAARDPATVQALMFTSGSTGAPKAVICGTGRMAMLAQINFLGFTKDDVAYSAMPLFHGNAVMAMFAPSVAVGNRFAMRRRFSASGFVPDIRRFGATVVNYVGRSLAYVLAQPERDEESDNSLRVVFGTEASPRDRREFARRFGVVPTESYGCSEGAVVISRTPDTPDDALGVGGVHMDVTVLDADGRECPRARFDDDGRLLNADEAIGEIVNRTGAAMFEGYYRAPEATAERIDGPMYRSGDLAYRDSEGFFYFAGRLGDRLRVDGENFGAGPIERILSRLPGALVVAVYPVPDSHSGDQVMAAVLMEPGARFDPEAFTDFLSEQHDLGRKWWPAFVRLVEVMPTTATRKLAKPLLRRESWTVDDPVFHFDRHTRRYRAMDDGNRQELLAEFADQGRDVHGR